MSSNVPTRDVLKEDSIDKSKLYPKFTCEPYKTKETENLLNKNLIDTTSARIMMHYPTPPNNLPSVSVSQNHISYTCA